MRYLTPYRAAIRLLPRPRYRLEAIKQQISDEQRERFLRVFRAHRARGGALVLFSENAVSDFFVFGQAQKGQAVTGDTAFRVASVSKTITAAGVMALWQQGLVDLNQDLDRVLPYSLRHPKAPKVPITLFMLLTHTAGIRDGQAYNRHLTQGVPAEELLKADSHTDHLPGEGCEYSNFGVGLVACALEAMLGQSFESLMQQALFAPLSMRATYYPFLVKGPLASAQRVLPPARRPGFDAGLRQSRVVAGYDQPDPQQHYTLAQGSCCLDPISLARLGQALMSPGFFREDSLTKMKSPLADLEKRDPTLKQGLGMFLLNDPRITKRVLTGHQGMAYGAVHQLFLDGEKKRGLISLTTGASEAREHIVSDLNKALLSAWQELP